ncbi:MAG: NADH-quinone oxidoreductase subunit NuoK [Candidatus Thermoplasmatota archaeon]|jgi:NADH:ubiquinone oxidoreductase subunit K|nr:NADH-quinone oxidoreductase subunit NuoK [Candidatus Thermoplasmatota archaeon]MCL5681357.1 NADH-quinone oxidoreductase subunit NuoK [Candidatus Thermoplasmatota archaeon]
MNINDLVGGPLNIGVIEFFSIAILSVGIFSFLSSKTVVKALISVEIMINAGLINLIAASSYYGNAAGANMTLFILVISAAETVVAMALFIAVFRAKGSASLDVMKLMRW